MATEGSTATATEMTNFVYKWTDEDVRKLIHARIEHRAAFSGRRNAAAHGWEIVLKDIGLEGVVTPLRAGKKWENLKTHYKELKQPPTGQGTESGEATAGSWKWYPLMDEALGGRPSIQPPFLIIVDLKSCHQTIRSRDSRCHMLPDLLSTLLILVEMWLVSVVIRPEDLLSWLHNVSVGNTDVVQYGATSDDLRRKGWLHLQRLEENGSPAAFS
ncbi:hypothetical protein AAFF_G00036760 [Aldrovandia affinis]|uniref:Myb/SANT-like DNA-binding domain-containing protein n=1 Tax=Aldrovandia affinis TaxID=143900 RepID=A0AAD7R263_9TELE|nr:hypothetical protein AAFF_G00036760 [Aldrovandia affinis]